MLVYSKGWSGAEDPPREILVVRIASSDGPKIHLVAQKLRILLFISSRFLIFLTMFPHVHKFDPSLSAFILN